MASILWAFAIDAWWDRRTQARVIAEQRLQLRAQMQANSEALQLAADRARDAVAALHTTFVTGPLGGGGGTDFEVPVSDLLTDPRIESGASELAMRAETLADTADEVRAAADSILTLTEPGTD